MQKKLISTAVLATLLAACSGETDNTLNTSNDEGSVSITGTAESGQRLTAVIADDNGFLPTNLSISWLADGSVIEGATTDELDVSDAQIGAVITVSVSYTDNDGFSESATSVATAAVVAAPPENDGAAVSIAGAAQVGATLTAMAEDPDGLTGAVSYQWLADGTAISGATGNTLVLGVAQLGAAISVNATYTDDDGFDESPVSAATTAVVAAGVNSAGVLAITGDVLVGQTVTATITDGNGTSAVAYQWQADGVDLVGATTESYTITANERGKVLSVDADYTDNDGFVEDLTGTHSDVVFSFIATGETTFAAAVSSAVDGDWIGLADAVGDDYHDMAQIDIATNNVVIRLAANSSAVITGEACIMFDSAVTGVVMEGLVFNDLTFNYNTDCLSPDGSVVVDGDANILRNNQFLGDQNPRPADFGSSDEYHYVTLGGTNNIVERNLFANKTTANNFEGSAISMYVNPDAGEDESNTVQYNLFKDFGDKGDDSRDSNTFAVQVGRSTGDDATGTGNHVVQYNRFDNVNTNRRLIMVQGGGNTIHGNTVVNSLGNIALENGFGNTVSQNIVISSAEKSEDSGISFAPLGHEIVDNYIGNVTATSNDRAGLHIDSDPLDPSSSDTILADATLDLTTVVARNTFINNDRAIQFEHSSSSDSVDNCTLLDYLIDFDNNLVANQSEANNIFGSNSGDGDAAVFDQGWIDNGCSLDANTDFDNNHFYAASLSESGSFDFNGIGAGTDGNIGADGTEDGASLTAPDSNLLVEGTGVDAGIGVDIDILNFINETDVGPNSSWTP